MHSFTRVCVLFDGRYLNLSADAKDLLLKMLADDPKARPTCLEVLKHPFMTADESTAAAHREMGDLVRNRMRDLAQLRWAGSSASSKITCTLLTTRSYLACCFLTCSPEHHAS